MRLSLSPSRRRALLLVPLALLLSLPVLAERPHHRDDDDDEHPAPHAPMKMMRTIDFSDSFINGELGATPGGAQDISFFRDRVAGGEVPHPNVFTPEGLFSEHDLPLENGSRCTQLMCVKGQATDGAILVQPDVRYIAQLGFSSGLDAATFHRPALNVVAVVDQSGSMSGHPIEMVKASLHELVKQLDGSDRLAIVLYGDGAHVHLASTAAGNRAQLDRAVDAIAINGSTNLESGLKLGFSLAQKSKREFDGLTRVMLFTDERPNVGATDAESFMGMAEANSRAGIGLTTVGVGVQFGAELATKISSVRGGNLFFFPNEEAITKVFAEELDMIVTELAYDLSLEVKAAPGLKIAGMYGIPGEMLEWTDDGGLRLHISTVFASKRKGAIYAAFSSDTRMGLPESRIDGGATVGHVELAYEAPGGTVERSTVDLPYTAPANASIGLIRGVLLINQTTALKEATRLHHEKNDQEGAYQLVHSIASIYRQITDADLEPERKLVEDLERTLAKLSGHEGEPSTSRPVHVDPVTGLPQRAALGDQP